MRGLIYTATIAMGLMSGAAQAATLYLEDFSGQNGKGVTGTGTNLSGVDWTATAPGVLNNKDYLKVVSGRLQARDVNSPATWLSPIISVAGYTDLALSMSLDNNNKMEAPDTVAVSYSLDGGAFTLIEDYLGTGLTGATVNNDFAPTLLTESVANGSTLQLQVTFMNNGGAERFYVDDVTVTGLAAVPVPAMGAGLIAGLGALVAFGRRRKG